MTVHELFSVIEKRSKQFVKKKLFASSECAAVALIEKSAPVMKNDQPKCD